MATQTISMSDVSDEAQNRNNRQVQQFTDQLLQVPFLNGAFLKSQALKSGDNVVNHGLGKAYTSYFLGRTTVAVSIFDSTLPGTDTTKQIQLNASAACTIDLWVF